MVCNPTLFLCYKKRLNSHLSTKIKPTKKAWHNYIDQRSTNYTMLLFNIINRAASPQIITCSGKYPLRQLMTKHYSNANKLDHIKIIWLDS